MNMEHMIEPCTRVAGLVCVECASKSLLDKLQNQPVAVCQSDDCGMRVAAINPFSSGERKRSFAIKQTSDVLVRREHDAAADPSALSLYLVTEPA
jgi:hypothetical protein